MTPPLDGSLSDWDDISEAEEWAVLLLGNGLSINVWPSFAYRSLFDHAAGGGLTADDLLLFEGTPNFERVLADLNTAIRVAQAAGVDPAPFFAHYRRIQLALGHAIRQVHLTRSDVPDESLAAIRAAMLEYEWIFTTSYDLIVYWAMGASPSGSFTPFKDHFRYGGNCEFDPTRADVYEHDMPVYFLHGALHLVAGGDGVTWKLRRNAIETILDQFGRPIAGDPQARPLLVTEGSAREKLRAIESNDYLSHCLGLLREIDLPVVVFGSSLSTEDQHLLDALNEHPNRTIAVSLLPGAPRQLATEQAAIYGRLLTDNLFFFDATTYPLGSPDLRA
jgi:hypothetical protein